MLSAHGAILVGVIAAFYKYGDRTEVFEKSLKGTGATLSLLRREIAFTLALRLQPVFDNPASIIEITVLDATGNPIRQADVSPAGSESYNEAVTEFVSSNVEYIVDYGSLMSAKTCWSKWARRLSWTLLAAILIQAIVLAGLFLWCNVLQHAITNGTLGWTFAPTLVLAIACASEMAVILYAHDIVTEVRTKYESP